MIGPPRAAVKPGMGGLLLMLESSALPPVERLLVVHEAGGELDIVEIAELPQLLGCAGVLEEDPVDLEGIEVPGAEVVQRR